MESASVYVWQVRVLPLALLAPLTGVARHQTTREDAHEASEHRRRA